MGRLTIDLAEAGNRLVMLSNSTTEPSDAKGEKDSSDADEDFIALAQNAAKVRGALKGVVFRLVTVRQFGYVFKAFRLSACVRNNLNLGSVEVLIWFAGRHHDGIWRDEVLWILCVGIFVEMTVCFD